MHSHRCLNRLSTSSTLKFNFGRAIQTKVLNVLFI